MKMGVSLARLGSLAFFAELSPRETARRARILDHVVVAIDIAEPPFVVTTAHEGKVGVREFGDKQVHHGGAHLVGEG